MSVNKSKITIFIESKVIDQMYVETEYVAKANLQKQLVDQIRE